MSAVRKIIVASVAALVILGLFLFVITRHPSPSRAPLRFTLDWKFEGPADLEGKTLGAPASDAAYAP